MPKEAAKDLGLLYFMSRTDDILSPYLASKPPAEKEIEETKSEFKKLSPSCCPERIKKGR